jgi:phosphoserine phosphatase
MSKTKSENIKLITIDGDGCLFSYDNVGSAFRSSWDALGFAYGLKEKWDERIEKYYGKPKFDRSWAEEDVADLRGLKVEDSFKELYPVPYCKGAREFAEASRGKLLRGILSTGIDIVVNKASEELGLDFAYCNILHRDNGTFSGTVSYLVPTWTKSERIENICERYHVNPEEICHIGDNENDLPVGEKVGMFIALKPKKEEVRAAGDYVVEDFIEVMKIFNLRDGRK